MQQPARTHNVVELPARGSGEYGLADAAVEDRNAAAAKLVLQVHGMLTDKLEIEQKQQERRVPDLEELKREIEELDKLLAEE